MRRLLSLFLLALLALTGCQAGLAPPQLKKDVTAHTTEYDQVITVLKPIDRVSVRITYQGGLFYRVQVENKLPYPINLKWDDSVYVSTGGESVRLLRIADRSELPEHAQLPQAHSPIAPDAMLRTDFIGETWLKLSGSGISPKPGNKRKSAFIYLTFEIKDRPVLWQGEIAFVRKPD